MLLPATAQTCRPGLHRARYVMMCAINRAWVQKWFFKRIEYISREKKIPELRLRSIALQSIESILYLKWIIGRSLAINFWGHCHISSLTVLHALIYTANWLLLPHYRGGLELYAGRPYGLCRLQKIVPNGPCRCYHSSN